MPPMLTTAQGSNLSGDNIFWTTPPLSRESFTVVQSFMNDLQDRCLEMQEKWRQAETKLALIEQYSKEVTDSMKNNKMNLQGIWASIRWVRARFEEMHRMEGPSGYEGEGSSNKRRRGRSGEEEDDRDGGLAKTPRK